VFGPRFAFYPAVVQLEDGSPGLDVDLAVVEGQSAIDRLCRIALARYRAWARARGSGNASRAVVGDAALPFPDARLD